MTLVDGGTLHRLAAFASTPDGGNPAGVWIGESLPDAAAMQRIAADVGYSETAFLAPLGGTERTIRYYSPKAEVTFCGHATIATGVMLGELSGEGRYRLATAVGDVAVEVRTAEGRPEASLTSVPPRYEVPGEELISGVLASLSWRRDELDESIPPARAYAGAWHIVLAARERGRLEHLDYDFDRLREIMLGDGLTTIQLVWREAPAVFHARNPFPVGGVVEDPATGAAAAALGGYLREAGLLAPPVRLTIHQGHSMGRPSTLRVHIPVSGGIVVSGTAVRI